MLCTQWQDQADAHAARFPNIMSSFWTQNWRPALIPSKCSLAIAEAEDLVRVKIQQALFPPIFRTLESPGPASTDTSNPVTSEHVAKTDDIYVLYKIFEIETLKTSGAPRESKESSPTPNRNSIAGTATMSRALRDARRRRAWLKARAQCARNRQTQRSIAHSDIDVIPYVTAETSTKVGPRRKHSAFVVEEELKCLEADRAGTPHTSTLEADDAVSGQLDVEELSAGGGVVFQDSIGESLRVFIALDVTDFAVDTERAT